MRKIILPLALLLLFAFEIMRVFFIMPFPGSQYDNTVDLAYFLHRVIFWVRIILLVIIFWQGYKLIKNRKWGRLTFTIIFLVLFGLIYYILNFRLIADHMFYQPENKIFATASENKVGMGKLIIGVSLNGEERAYPIEIIGYHHQVRDIVGGKPIMATYCTVCRTGRVYDPVYKGKEETFRLVGMDHFNAMFEDETTKSWWRQATGEAVTGPEKGNSLTEIFSEQMTLKAWLTKYPDSKIMQPDEKFLQDYESLAGFDEGTIQSDLEMRDKNSWQFKSWVIGVDHNGYEKAYDWNDVVKGKVINDSIPGTAILIVIENDLQNFHVYESNLNGQSLKFTLDETGDFLVDNISNSKWNMNGVCTEGLFKDSKLKPVQAYQEFYHSWKQFHPGSTYFGK
ncbi:MAG: DUF3179 domain-containing (seleno)protein [Chitinophagales bacterium]